MAVDAARLDLVMLSGVTTPDVLGVGHRLKVERSYAVLVKASTVPDVVDDQSGRYRPVGRCFGG
jgi:hypothetical protein